MRHLPDWLPCLAVLFLAVASLLTAVGVGTGHGWVVGAVSFLVFWLLLVVLIAVLFPLAMLVEYARRGGPRYPSCHNGTCTGRRWPSLNYADRGDYTLTVVDGEAVLRCRCGREYVERPPGRFMERLPDGTLRPYMVHRNYRGWFPDGEV